jgi:PAS domain S-box-containing protein
MFVVTGLSIGTSYVYLYNTSIENIKKKLRDLVEYKKCFVTVALNQSKKHFSDSPEIMQEEILQLIKEAFAAYVPVYETAELIVSYRKDGNIVFLTSQFHGNGDPKHLLFPYETTGVGIRHSLSQQSGIVSGPDYRGVPVLAAYDYLEQLGFGFVAKVELAEIRKTYLRSAVWGGITSLVFIIVGTIVIFMISNPLLVKLESNQARMQTIMNNIVDVLFIIDEQGIIESCNPSTERIFGYRKEELVGKSINVLLPGFPTDKEKYVSKRFLMKDEGNDDKNSMGIQGQHENGATIPLDLSLSAFFINRRCLYAGVARDITARKKMEKKLHDFTQNLERKVEERTAELRTLSNNLRNEIQVRRDYEQSLKNSLSILDATLESTADGILVVNLNNEVQFCNQNFLELCQISKSTIFALSWKEAIVHVLDQLVEPESFRKSIQEISSRKEENSFDIVQFKNGRILECYSKPRFVNGKNEGRVWSFRDVTHRQLIENDLRKKRDLMKSISALYEKGILKEDEKELVDICVNEAVRLTESEFGFIYLSKENQPVSWAAINDSVKEACNIPNSESVMHRKELESRGILGKVIQKGETQIINDVEFDDETVTMPEGHPPIKTFIGCPLHHGDKTIGMIGLANKKNGYVESDQHHVNSLGIIFVEVLYHKHTQKALKQSEEQYRSLISSVEDIVFRIDTQGHLTFASNAFRNTLGYEPEEWIGKSIQPFLSTDSFETAKHYLKSWREGKLKKESVSLDLVMLRKDGADIFAEVRVSPFYDSNGQLAELVGIARDVSERKRMEKELLLHKEHLELLVDEKTIAFRKEFEERMEAEKELAQIFELSVHLICIADINTATFLKINSAFMTVLGYTKEELLAKPFTEFVHSDDLQPTLAVIRKKLKIGEKVINFENRYRRRDGTYVWLDWTACPDPDKGITFSIAQDITTRKKTEEELKNLHNYLVKAKEEAESANRAKSEFLSRMSHELRTPMNSVLGFAQLLESDPTEPLTESQLENVTQILKAGNYLLNLINEVLDLAQIESGKLMLSLEPIRLDTVLEEVLTLMEPITDRYAIHIDANLADFRDHIVLADHLRLKQVFLNIISNAIKYNRKNGFVMVKCKAGEGEKVRVNITDTGTGISPEKQKELFKPFERLGAETTEIEGTGIGLAIAKHLIDAMGGNIGVDSKPGKGSTFFVDLVSAEREITAMKPLSLPTEDVKNTCPANRTLLYIEDNPANLKLMSKILSRRPDIRMLSAPDGYIGIEVARAYQPDLIFLDINLPGMNGYAVLNSLQTHAETQNIPVVAVSAAAMESDIRKGREAGFHDYLTKPFNISQVLNTINILFDIKN